MKTSTRFYYVCTSDDKLFNIIVTWKDEKILKSEYFLLYFMGSSGYLRWCDYYYIGFCCVMIVKLFFIFKVVKDINLLKKEHLDNLIKIVLKCFHMKKLFFLFYSYIYRFTELQFLNARRAAVSAASALAPPTAPPSITSQATSLHGSAHPPEFHPAYRLGSYMDHLYSLQHAAAATSPSASLHGTLSIKLTL